MLTEILSMKKCLKPVKDKTMYSINKIENHIKLIEIQ